MADKKITVNVVAPGGIKTDMYHAVCREYIPNGENLSNEEVDEVNLYTTPEATGSHDSLSGSILTSIYSMPRALGALYIVW